MACAEGWVEVGRTIAARLRATGRLAKGNVLETARLAGFLAVKRTPELIPLCHPLALEAIDISADLVGTRVRIECRVRCEGKTGVEMEALTGVTVAALTVYDMVKSLGKDVTIGPVRLMEKSGGRSGRWVRGEDDRGTR
jgi:cyclic pyranopterin phosphate synthase